MVLETDTGKLNAIRTKQDQKEDYINVMQFSNHTYHLLLKSFPTLIDMKHDCIKFCCPTLVMGLLPEGGKIFLKNVAN